MQKLTIPATTILELEQWGKATSTLFHRLRRQAGIVPTNTPQHQTWFWSATWQSLEKQAEDDIKTGQIAVFDTVDDLLADLET